MLQGKIWTPSNALCILRIFLLYPIYQGLSQNTPAGNRWALFLMTVAVLTDYMDGFLARRLKQVSDVGKILDPLADKLCVGLGIFALYQYYGLPLWITAVIIGRDILIILGSLVLMAAISSLTKYRAARH